MDNQLIVAPNEYRARLSEMNKDDKETMKIGLKMLKLNHGKLNKDVVTKYLTTNTEMNHIDAKQRASNVLKVTYIMFNLILICIYSHAFHHP